MSSTTRTCSPASTRIYQVLYDRRWMISEFIFNEKVNRLLDYKPTRTIYGTSYEVAGDSGVHWSPKTERGDKFRRTITNPFLLPEKVGVRYYGKEALTTGHLLTMVGNAKRIAGHMSSESAMRSQYPAIYALMKDELRDRETLRTRESFLTTYGYMERILREIYGDRHEALLPKLVRVDIPFRGCGQKSFQGRKHIGFNDPSLSTFSTIKMSTQYSVAYLLIRKLLTKSPRTQPS